MQQKIISIKKYIREHKFLSVCIALTIILIGYYTVRAFTSTSGETRYVTALAQKGTIISSISGSGQVSASDEIDIKSKVSGDILSLPVKAGDVLRRGDIIAQIDPHDAQVALANAQLSYQKLTEPADSLSLLQAQNALTAAKEDLTRDYENGFNSITGAFLDLPGIVTDLNDLFYSKSGFLNYDSVKTISDTAGEYQQTAATQYDAAKALYDKTFALYKTLDRTSSTEQIESLIDTAYETVRSISEATKDAKDTVDYIQSISNARDRAQAQTTLSDLDTWTNTINSNLSDLLTAKTAIQNDKRSIQEKTDSLAKLKEGADPLDVQSEQLSLQEKQNDLADYTIRAPFDGIMAKVDSTSHDSVSSGTTIGTFVTKEKIAEVSLNEVDAAKVATGQKATLTFDAIEGLSIAGTVSEVDLVGTVTQGVVNYTIKIGFDTQDDRIKPGMTVSAAIVTNVKENVLTVPNSAVKSDAQGSYVQVFNPPLSSTAGGAPSTVAPTDISVTTGLSDDSATEIIDGITEGTQVVTRIIAPTTAATTPAAPSLLGGNRTAGGGTFRSR